MLWCTLNAGKLFYLLCLVEKRNYWLFRRHFCASFYFYAIKQKDPTVYRYIGTRVPNHHKEYLHGAVRIGTEDCRYFEMQLVTFLTSSPTFGLELVFLTCTGGTFGSRTHVQGSWRNKGWQRWTVGVEKGRAFLQQVPGRIMFALESGVSDINNNFDLHRRGYEPGLILLADYSATLLSISEIVYLLHRVDVLLNLAEL